MSWVREHLRVCVVVTLGMLTIMAVTTLLVVGVGSPTSANWYILGLVHATCVAIYLAMLNAIILASDRTAMTHLKGAWGEENTRSELAIAKRRGLIWGWVDTITLQSGDLDHVVVTRRGGVVVIDSKWRNSVTADDVAAMTAAADKLRLRSEALATQVLKKRRSLHRADGRAVNVRPIVVIWGPEQGRLMERQVTRQNVDFVAGKRLRRWLAALDGDNVDRKVAAELVSELEDFRDEASARHRV